MGDCLRMESSHNFSSSKSIDSDHQQHTSNMRVQSLNCACRNTTTSNEKLDILRKAHENQFDLRANLMLYNDMVCDEQIWTNVVLPDSPSSVAYMAATTLLKFSELLHPLDAATCQASLEFLQSKVLHHIDPVALGDELRVIQGCAKKMLLSCFISLGKKQKAIGMFQTQHPYLPESVLKEEDTLWELLPELTSSDEALDMAFY